MQSSPRILPMLFPIPVCQCPVAAHGADIASRMCRRNTTYCTENKEGVELCRMLTEQVPAKDRAKVKEAAELLNRAAAVRAVRLRVPDAEPDRVVNKVRDPDAAVNKVKREAVPGEVDSIFVNVNEKER